MSRILIWWPSRHPIYISSGRRGNTFEYIRRGNNVCCCLSPQNSFWATYVHACMLVCQIFEIILGIGFVNNCVCVCVSVLIKVGTDYISRLGILRRSYIRGGGVDIFFRWQLHIISVPDKTGSLLNILGWSTFKKGGVTRQSKTCINYSIHCKFLFHSFLCTGNKINFFASISCLGCRKQN